ncbi:Reeler domain-containing protein [Marinicella meishanensis]|uniref:Reeler domain-containing protein n=1 Tax=Marinicella meishanensis TaxID=2873263 RepID=UPI001CBEAE7B|nr:Reeler domain-containing protein [Marinicella sp. NBU2979]
MKKILISVLSILLMTSAHGLPTGAPVCDVFADYSNVTGMTNRTRNPNSGTYQLTANVTAYNPFEHVEITITGDSFLGLMFTVVDEQGNKVGTFSPDTQVRDCDGQAMSITHSDRLGLTSKTLFWIPPSDYVGTVYVLGYVLEGAAGTGAAQNFYRFVRDDNSALAIPESDVIFLNSFD